MATAKEVVKMQTWNSRKLRYLLEDVQEYALVYLVAGFVFVIGILGVVLFFGILLVPMMIAQGWVLSMLWGLFVSPRFGLPDLALAPAIGLMVLFHFIVHRPESRRRGRRPKELSSREKKALVEGLFVGGARPFLALLTGYIVHLFV